MNRGVVPIGDEVVINNIKPTIVDFKNGQPVYQALVTPNLNFTESDGYAIKTDSVYANARTASSAASVSDATLSNTVMNSFVSSTYLVNRGYLYFDTSSLSGYVVSAGTLNLYVNSKADNNNESILIQSGQPTYPHDPLVVGDFDLANYAGNGGSKDITTFSLNAYNAVTLDAGGLAMINTSGTTKMHAFRKASDELKQGVQRNLEGIINKQKDILTLLWDETRSHARAISDTIQSELLIHGDKDFLSLAHGADKHGYLRLKTQLECTKADYSYKGIFICDAAGTIHLTTENEKSLIGVNIMKEKSFRNVHETLYDGKTYISDVIHYSVNTAADGGKAEDSPSLFISYPIKGGNHDVIGAVLLWMDASMLNNGMKNVAWGKTGEAYLVNKDGIMITHSRFSDQIKNTDDICRTCHKVADPTTTLLTKGVKRCITGKTTGYDLKGYRDYDGLKVVGEAGNSAPASFAVSAHRSR